MFRDGTYVHVSAVPFEARRRHESPEAGVAVNSSTWLSATELTSSTRAAIHFLNYGIIFPTLTLYPAPFVTDEVETMCFSLSAP